MAGGTIGSVCLFFAVIGWFIGRLADSDYPLNSLSTQNLTAEVSPPNKTGMPMPRIGH
jgi:hypothetical protein